MIKLPSKHLERSPEETARRLATGLLDEAAGALKRLRSDDDPEALHDFRVALRRLRSTLRAYRPHLKGSSPRKLRRRLKSLASATNPARDVEVQIEWLEREGERLKEPARAGARRLAERLRSEPQASVSPRAIETEFAGLEKNVRQACSRMRLDLEDDGRTFLMAAGELLKDQGLALDKRLQAAETAEHADELHQARIACKRLRYLLEPLQQGVGKTRELVKRLKSLQDILGDLQDTRVMMDSISKEIESAALEKAHELRDRALGEDPPADSPAPDAELATLLRVQRDRRDRSFRELERKWRSEAGREFFRTVEELADQLATGRVEARSARKKPRGPRAGPP